MSDMQINAVLGQIRALREQIDHAAVKAPTPTDDAKESFGAVLGQFVSQVNEAQAASTDLAARFEQGDEKVSLAQVMVASQKSSVSFQAVMQVRNKLLSAYQDVMNMQI
ncbi:MAG: flagellar hook-basal body complex protein FliE [Gammaproteobacteria bacterium]